MFMLMLRCGLRVEEIARLTADAIEYRRRQLYVFAARTGLYISAKML
jgi:integrase